jgi:hypothetical protein
LKRIKDIENVNKREIFRARRDEAIIAYVNQYNAVHRNERIVEKLKSFGKIRQAYKCLKQGIKEKKYALHLVEYGQWAALKMQIKLMRKLTIQFGTGGRRLNFDDRIVKRTQ